MNFNFNFKTILFACTLLSTQLSSLYTAYSHKKSFGADDVLKIFEEAASHAPTAENLARALRNEKIDKAYLLFEKGAPATEALFIAYIDDKELTAARKDNAKKIFAKLPETSQKKMALYTLTEALNDKEPTTALFALELGAQTEEEHISTFLYKVDMRIENGESAKKIRDNILLFEKLLDSANFIPSSKLFLPAAKHAPRFAEMLLQKGTKPNKGDLIKIFSSKEYDLSDKESLAELILATDVELTDDEIIYLFVNMPAIAKLRDLIPTESMQSKIDAQIKEKEVKEKEVKEKEVKEKEKSQKEEDYENIRENLLKDLPDDMKQKARYWTDNEIKQKIDEHKSRNTMLISTAVVGAMLLGGYSFYKYKQLKKEKEKKQKKDKHPEAASETKNRLPILSE